MILSEFHRAVVQKNIGLRVAAGHDLIEHAFEFHSYCTVHVSGISEKKLCTLHDVTLRST